MNLRQEDQYCQKCGGLVDLKNCLTKLVSPPIQQYHCSECYALVLEIRNGDVTNVQSNRK